MLQSLLKEMLEVIDGICREEKIPYMLWGGSCLGAVREHDIIPWDDDLDIIVWRKEEKSFRKDSVLSLLRIIFRISMIL